MNPTEMRSLIPALGLPEYWYPALPEASVPRNRPAGFKIMGEEIAFFRDKDGTVAAIADVCPHRGGSLRRGDCHYPGTIACPYHGWVFDARGECVAVLSEGPDSRIPGKVRSRVFPTRTLKGMVFVWMGKGAPAPIEEDVPPEFFDGEDTLVMSATRYWPVNWRVALENALDSHVMYVHRNALLQLMEPILQFGPAGYRPRIVNGRAALGYIPDDEAPRPAREYYPGVDGHWPKTQWRRLWLWAFAWRLRRRVTRRPFNPDEEWGMHTFIGGKRVRSGGHHLPSMFRFDFGTHMYTRACVPVDEQTTRVIYYHAIRRRTAIGRALARLFFVTFQNWAMNANFSDQDYRVMAPQRYDTAEKLSGTDAEVIAWRRLLLSARGMPARGDLGSVDDLHVETVGDLQPGARPR
jgi:phenylpropionate dioxygenase-like ring-hydroxylating dioxygenase large terminal subunit